MGDEVVVAPGLFYVDCSFGPLEAGEAIADGLKWHLLGCPFEDNLPVGQIWTFMGSIGSHVEAWDPLPLSNILLWPKQSPANLSE